MQNFAIAVNLTKIKGRVEIKLTLKALEASLESSESNCIYFLHNLLLAVKTLA